MKKGDIVIILSGLAVTVVCFCLLFFGGEEGKTVVIKEDNRIVYESSVSVDKTVELDTNTIQIAKGKVKMLDSTCKNQICVKHKEISKKNETIICLPNKIIVEIK